jgi:glycosidase
LGESNGEEVVCDFFTLRDFWTKPDSPHFDALVNEFVQIYAFYIDVIGVDGLRIDTVKHVHHEFWDAFCERLRDKVGPQRASRLLLFGEVYDGNPDKLGRYTYRSDAPQRDDPCLDSLLNFQFCFNVRDYLRVKDAAYGSPAGLQQTIDAMNRQGERATYNPSPGLDGLSSRQKMVNFTENHDGINRFLVDGVTLRANTLAMGITMAFEGVPCIYYGSELPLQDERGTVGRDGESGRLTFCQGGDLGMLDRAKSTLSFRTIKSLSDMRQQFAALHRGRMNPLWVDDPDTDRDDGIFAMARYIESSDQIETGETVIVVVNANDQSAASTASGAGGMRLLSHGNRPLVSRGDRLRVIEVEGQASAQPAVDIQWMDDTPQVRLTVPPQSIHFYRVEAP